MGKSFRIEDLSNRNEDVRMAKEKQAKGAKGAKAGKEQKQPKDAQVPKDVQEPEEVTEPKEPKEPKEPGQIIKWLDAPQPHDYPAALSYLCLLYSPKEGKAMVKQLKASKVVSFKAKDIFRASTLSLLGVSNSHVEKDRQTVLKGEPLSPILLVRDGTKVVIADGYHRMCAVYSFDEDALIPCKIV